VVGVTPLSSIDLCSLQLHEKGGGKMTTVVLEHLTIIIEVANLIVGLLHLIAFLKSKD